MRVLLVKPEFKNVFTKLSLITTEPLELEYVSSVVKKEGHEVIFVDMMLEKKPLKYFIKKYIRVWKWGKFSVIR